jgi:hypothetical protein
VAVDEFFELWWLRWCDLGRRRVTPPRIHSSSKFASPCTKHATIDLHPAVAPFFTTSPHPSPRRHSTPMVRSATAFSFFASYCGDLPSPEPAKRPISAELPCHNTASLHSGLWIDDVAMVHGSMNPVHRFSFTKLNQNSRQILVLQINPATIHPCP